MIAFADAVAAVRAEASTLSPEPVRLDDALGRVLAEAVASPVELPPFDNSAMDGFALASGGATLARGIELDVHGEAAAGDPRQQAGHGAFEIMTGARIPDGLDTVIPVEQVEVLARDDRGRAQRIRLQADLPPGQHVRRAGEDVARDALVMAAGEPIGAAQLSLLAALGVPSLLLRRRPRAALVCTGRELVDDPAAPLGAGQIRNSNGPYLEARLRTAGADVVHRATVDDDVDAFVAEIAQARTRACDLIVSTGAVSMGRYDFVPEALARLGARIVFHKVAMRPGKPLLFAVLPDGTLYFGLPGNPVSSAIGMRFFVEAALAAMLGLPPERPLRIPLATAVHKKPGFRLLQKARVEPVDGGRLQVVLLRGQESFRLAPLVAANAWAVLPEAGSELDAGSPIEVHGLDREQFTLHGVQAT